MDKIPISAGGSMEQVPSVTKNSKECANKNYFLIETHTAEHILCFGSRQGQIESI